MLHKKEKQMRISKVDSTVGIYNSSKVNFSSNRNDISCVAKDFVPTTVRRNSLSDIDFNIVADTIRCQNLQNQMNVRLMNLRRTINGCVANNIYKEV